MSEDKFSVAGIRLTNKGKLLYELSTIQLSGLVDRLRATIDKTQNLETQDGTVDQTLWGLARDVLQHADALNGALARVESYDEFLKAMRAHNTKDEDNAP